MKQYLRTSVVMTTYNGEQFIFEQLDSLKKQTRKIDEVLIFDDGSKDGTVRIIEEFIDNNELENWNIFINEKNKGWKRNFYEAVLKSSGDIVFPCDQDDIWKNYKIEKMTSYFEENPNVDVLVGKYEKYFMENVEQKISINWKSFGLLADKIENVFYKKSLGDDLFKKREFNKSFLQLEPGCCFGVRKTFFNEIKDYWFEDLGHDAFFTFFSELKDSYYNLNETVILWRHYVGSTSRPKERSKKIRVEELMRNEKVIEMMLNFIKSHGNLIKDKEQKIKILNNANKWNESRKNFIIKNNIFDGLSLIFFIKYYERYRAVLTDWIYAFMKK